MKTFLLTICLAFGWGLNSYAQVDLPSSCYFLEWNTLSQAWDSLHHDQYSYTFAGGEAKVDERTRSVYDASVWSLSERHALDYTFTGDFLAQGVEKWSGSGWENRGRYSFAYDQNTQKTGYFWEEFNGTGYDTVLHYRYLNSYNAQNQPIEITTQKRNVNLQTWQNTLRETRSYNAANEVDQVEIEFWEGAWEKKTKNRDYVWFNFAADQPLEYHFDVWDDQTGAYRKDGLYTFAYTDSFGSYTKTFQLYDSTTNSYRDQQMWVYQFDQYGNKLLEENYWYYDVAGKLIYNRGDRWNLTYNASGAVVEEFYAYRFDSLAPWIPSTLKSCVDFVVGDAPEVETDLIVQWAPHPVGSAGNLIVEAERPGPLKVEVLDVRGKMLREYELQQGPGQQSHSLNLGLPAGLYVYRIRQGERSTAGRLLVD